LRFVNLTINEHDNNDDENCVTVASTLSNTDFFY